MRLRLALFALPFACAPAFTQVPDRPTYADRCAIEMGRIPAFNCLAGALLPITVNGVAQTKSVDECDRPVQLQMLNTGKQCVPFSRIQTLRTLSWEVLSTPTPTDYTSFRHVLGSSAGFQSAQFRQVEYLLGLKDGTHLKFHEEGSAQQRALAQALVAPSLWDEANAALARAGFGVAAEPRDWSLPYLPSEAVEDAWAEVYRDTDRHWEFYQFAEKLVDIDDSMATWRHKHVLTVERIIGLKRGTGGTAGVPYLQSTLSKRAFPELWTLRTKL